jgi:hypothetical protein
MNAVMFNYGGAPARSTVVAAPMSALAEDHSLDYIAFSPDNCVYFEVREKGPKSTSTHDSTARDAHRLTSQMFARELKRSTQDIGEVKAYTSLHSILTHAALGNCYYACYGQTLY